MLLLHKMKEHFNARALEWGMSGWAMSWGTMVLLSPEMFTNPKTSAIFQGLSDISHWFTDTPHHLTIGWTFFLLGFVRALALFINGAWRNSPAVRLVASAVSAFLVTSLVVAISQGPTNTGTITYFWLFAADCLCAKRAAEDWSLSRALKKLATKS